MADMTTDQLEELRDRPGLFRQFADFARKQPLGTAGGVVVILYILMAVFAPYITGFDPTENFYQHQFVAPGAQFLMGTDEWGRDILTRVIYGSRTALFVGFTCAIVGSTVGLVLGVGSAYFGGMCSERDIETMASAMMISGKAMKTSMTRWNSRSITPP